MNQELPSPRYSYDKEDVSIPLLISSEINHEQDTIGLQQSVQWDDEKLGDRFLVEFRQAALLLYRTGINYKDLGRKLKPKKEPVRVIKDVDLHLKKGKVHVATEHGLLLAADYLEQIGVPASQPIEFQGKKPAWTKKIEVLRHFRRVEIPYPVPKDSEESGLLRLISGTTVTVYEIGSPDMPDIDERYPASLFHQCEKSSEPIPHEDKAMAYGMRFQDGRKGWFPYKHTGRVDQQPDPPREPKASIPREKEIIDWAEFKYNEIPALVQGVLGRQDDDDLESLESLDFPEDEDEDRMQE